MKSILDRSFRYTSSAQTDLRKTFARIRREQRLHERDEVQAVAEAKLKVAPIRRGRSAPGMLKQISPGKP
ncbi:MAG: hypothetical protein HY527_20435 [Betaproteobacteria bacterium]|nr:hypothetical protein [Betaproteobacteria bacterium]